MHAEIADASASAWLASLAPGLVVTVGVVVVVLLLGRLVQRIQLGAPFVGESVRALRTIGLTMLLGSWVAAFAAGVALAEAFAQGIRLQDDVEGLV